MYSAQLFCICVFFFHDGSIKFQARIQAALTIQRTWRSCISHVRLERNSQAVTVIQSWWRGVLARKQVAYLRDQHERRREHAAATTIQVRDVLVYLFISRADEI